MNIFNKLDRSSKFLFLISIVGILLSLAGFYFLGLSGTSDQDGLVEIGKIGQYQNDVRVKRSENIHWYPVHQSTTCYEDDLIFTGNDSTTEIELSNGNKIILYPNSLVSLSKGLVSLESGTIELDLSKGKENLRLQSFGEEIKVEKEAKIQVKKQEGVKKIVYLNKAAEKTQLAPAVKKLLNEVDLKLLAPSTGTLVPRHQAYRMKFQWSPREIAGTSLKLEFSKRRGETPFLTENVTGPDFEISTDKFPGGQIFWRVNAGSSVSDPGYFMTTSDFSATYDRPSNGEMISETERKETLFQWTPKFSLPQKIQVARSREFKELTLERETSLAETTYLLPDDGTYYWRVGSILPSGEVLWTKSSEFKFVTFQPIKSIQLSLKPRELDFSVEKSYKVQIQDENPCDSYEAVLYKDGEVITKTTLTTREYRLTKLESGSYELQVIGKKGDAETVAKVSFEVKNAEPLKAPKIIKKKKKLFVYFMQKAMDFVIPTAAADEGKIALEWEDDGSDQYEIEVKNEKGKELVKKTTKKSKFILQITEPGKYHWRVRSQRGNNWGPFSEYELIDANDKVILLSNPLMISGETLSADDQAYRVSLNWRTPYPDLSYKLELYNSPTGKPFKVMPVTGQNKTLKFSSKMKNVWWRIAAQSKHGEENPNQERFKVGFDPSLVKTKKPIEKKLPNKYFVNATIAQTSTSLKQETDTAELSPIETSESLMGQIMNFNVEMWPDSFRKDTILTFTGEYMSIAKSQSKLNKTEMQGEIGQKFWKGADRYHAFLVGFQKSIINLDIAEASTRLDMNFISGRYYYRQNLSEKTFWDLSAEMRLLLRSDFTVPSFKAISSYNYLIWQNLYLKGFLLFERSVYKAPYNEDGLEGDLTVNLQNIAGGVGVSWFID